MTVALLKKRRGSVAWLLALAALAIVLAALAWMPLGRAPSDARAGSLVGSPAPALTGVTLAGDPWSLSDRQASVLWVNFWATSCEPCRTEMPAMQRLAEAYRGDLEIVGVDWGEAADSVASFVERYGVTYEIVLDPALENYYRWASAAGLPRHYFVAADGTVVREVIGPLEPAAMVAILEELLGTPG